MVVRTRQGTEMQEQEHEVTTLFVGNNPLQLEQVGLAQAESVAQGGLLAVVLLKPQSRWAMAGNGLLTKILKDVFARVRPEHVHGAAQADGFSFPSGHSSASMVAYAMLAYLAVRLLPRAWQLPAVCCAGALIFTTGWSRVVLHVHYVSDVLAGWVLGGTWMVCTVLIMDSMARWRGAPAALARQ